LSQASHVFQDAARIIERLNGEALLVHSDAQPIKLGQVMKFDLNGKRQLILFAITGEFQITVGNARARVKARGTGVTNGPPSPPQESDLQRWFAEAERNDTLADLFSHLNRANNWFDVYKSAELARRLVEEKLAGAKPAGKKLTKKEKAEERKALQKAFSSDWEKLELVFRTANCHRHAPDPIKYPWPEQPVDLNEAREFILTIIPRLL